MQLVPLVHKEKGVNEAQQALQGLEVNRDPQVREDNLANQGLLGKEESLDHRDQ